MPWSLWWSFDVRIMLALFYVFSPSFPFPFICCGSFPVILSLFFLSVTMLSHWEERIFRKSLRNLNQSKRKWTCLFALASLALSLNRGKNMKKKTFPFFNKWLVKIFLWSQDFEECYMFWNGGKFSSSGAAININ